MEKIKPKKLKKGDTIGILAVSGRIKDIQKINNAKKFFESNGYKVVISDTCYSSHRYMAGNSDEECVKVIHDFFINDSIDAILCARGGYGTLRLINKIDWNIIKNNPKIFAGYSDITILLAQMYKKCNLITFHSAMANGDFGDEINEYTEKSFFSTLKGDTKTIKAENKTVYNAGQAEGTFWGGNLSSLVSLIGCDFIPDEDVILFLEDLNEPEYKIDKMLTQLFNTKGIKDKVKGIVLGEFKDVQNINWLNEIIKELANSLKIPVCGGYKITHGKVKDTIPYGVRVVFESDLGLINIKEEYITY